MKSGITILLIICFINGFSQKPASIPQSKYKTGFTYFDQRGVKTTLLRWEKVSESVYYKGRVVFPPMWRWATKVEFAGMTATTKTWTDDSWIDIALGKSFIKDYQIIYLK